MILVTGFEPYGGSSVNPSALVLEKLPTSLNGVTLRKELLVCDGRNTPLRVARLAASTDFRAVLLLGEDKRYAFPTIETTTYNGLEYDVPDNFGWQPRGSLIDPIGPESLACPLDFRAIQRILALREVRVDLSSNPGRHLCNQVFYMVRRQTDQKPVLLLHLPRLPEQQDHPSLPFEQSFTATRLILEVLANRENLSC
jgi:pyroglutamyl-peptidase